MDKIISFKNKVFDFIYKYRFIIAIVLIILGVLFKIHGSSISHWNYYINTDKEDTSLIFGKTRGIRSDEWAVTTPLIFSQGFSSFKYFSDILRGGTLTDAFTIYGLPVFSLFEIFRPFHFGYLFLGLARGLSFFWVARFIALFLVTFEFFMIFTNKNKRLSIIGSFMISLAPIVQWWFATNGTAELFIFGQLALILLYKYLNTENFKYRLLYLSLMVVCAGGYVLILYPAFQIPMFYVFLVLAIYIVITNCKNTKITKKDVISIIVTLLVFVLLMASIIYTSRDTISALLNTVYPGNRISQGGGAFRKYISYIDNIFLPYKEEGMETHPAKEAVMFGLFPMGIIIAIIAMIRNKKIDLPIMLLFIPYVVIGLFCMFNIPYLPQLTLLSYSSVNRAVMAIGYIDVLILLRSLSITEKSEKIWVSLIISFITSLVLVLICKKLNPNYVGKILASGLFVMCLYLFFFAMQYNTKCGKYLFTFGIIVTMLVAGFTVNPISIGFDVIENSPILQAAKEINESDSGIWLAENLQFPCQNYLAMAGCPVVNATNIYPNMDLWEMLDENKIYEEVYNRYAHVVMVLVQSEDEITDKFELISTDSIKVYITPNDLKEMNIKYVFTVGVMENFNNEKQEFELIYNDAHNYHIYKVNYK